MPLGDECVWSGCGQIGTSDHKVSRKQFEGVVLHLCASKCADYIRRSKDFKVAFINAGGANLWVRAGNGVGGGRGAGFGGGGGGDSGSDSGGGNNSKETGGQSSGGSSNAALLRRLEALEQRMGDGVEMC